MGNQIIRRLQVGWERKADAWGWALISFILPRNAMRQGVRVPID